MRASGSIRPPRGFFGHLGLWLVRLRWVVILLWAAVAVFAYVYLPPLDDRLTGRLSDLVPEEPSNLASRPAALSPPGATPGATPDASPAPNPGEPSPGQPEQRPAGQPAGQPAGTDLPRGPGAMPEARDPASSEEGRPEGPPTPLGSVEAPAVLVYSDPGGIGPEGMTRIGEDLAYLNSPYGPRRLEMAVPLAVPDPTTAAPVAGERSVLPVLLFFDAGASGGGIRDEVEQIRRTLGDRPGSLRAEVTGIRPVGEETIAAVKENLGKVSLATALAIFCILALTYRSPVAPLAPLASIGLATFLTLRLIAFFALREERPVPAQIEPVIIVLLFGVGTDYALFLLSRTRQALHAGATRAEAARLGVQRAGGVVVSSAAVLVAAFAVLNRAELEVYRTLGPALALALVVLTLVTLTLVPALLAVSGRAALGGTRRRSEARRRSNLLAARRPGIVAGVLVAVLLAASLGAAGLKVGFDQVEALPDDAPAAKGYETLARGFPAGVLSPVNVVVQGEDLDGPKLGRLRNELWGAGGFAAVLGPESAGLLPRVPFVAPDGSGARFLLVFYGDPYAPEALDQIERLQEDLPAMLQRSGLEGAKADVGGQAALAADARSISDADLLRLAPFVLAVAYVVLALLLRTPVAPLYLLGATILSFAATLGITTVLFQTLLGHDGVVYYVTFTLFILLVALGSDYNIFIMAAVREEAGERPLPEAVSAALSGTRGTINAAGLALAASFALLALIPLQDFFQVGIAVAVGILLDAFVIRTLLVPALVLLVGRGGFWPAKVRP